MKVRVRSEKGERVRDSWENWEVRHYSFHPLFDMLVVDYRIVYLCLCNDPKI